VTTRSSFLTGRNATDRLDEPTRKRVLRRLQQLAENPYDPGLSASLQGADGLRKSRVGAWRIIYQIAEAPKIVFIVMIERR
jgi:mRNA-degrading endonuclease RelE of RelBE toxin-antitoxin system